MIDKILYQLAGSCIQRLGVRALKRGDKHSARHYVAALRMDPRQCTTAICVAESHVPEKGFY